MKKWLITLLYAFLAYATFTNTAFADNSNVQTAVQSCAGNISATSIISPLVQCFTDTSTGIIPAVTTSFLSHANKDYLPLVATIFLLVIVYHGVRMFLGDIQRIKSDTIILGLKMAGVLLFLNNAPAIYIDMVNILQGLSQNISTAATSLHTTGFCIGGSTTNTVGASNSQWQWGGTGLWARWDCIFKYLLGFGAGGFAAAGIASFLLMMVYSLGTGFLVLFMALGVIFSLLQAAFRFIHVYLMATLALSFMFCLGYLFVPLLLFRNTFEYFNKWLSMVLGFILTPIIMFAFMGMMLMAVDITLFSGQFSLFCVIGGQSGGTCAGSDGKLFSNITGTLDPKHNGNIQAYTTQLFEIGLNGPSSLMASSITGSAQGALGTGVGTGCTGTPEQTATGYTCDMGQTATNFIDQAKVAAARVGIPTLQLNMSGLASAANDTCVSNLSGGGFGGSSGNTTEFFYTNCPWVENILISLCVAALVIYVMLSLLTYIPTLASNLSSNLIKGDLASSGKNMIESGISGMKGMASKSAAQGPDGGVVGKTMGAISNMVGSRTGIE